MKKILLFMVAVLLAFGFVSCDQEVNTKTYKVTYNANGAVGTVPATIEVEEGGNTTVPSCGSLSMKGYDFVGWNTKKDGSGKIYKESQSFKVDSDIILYGQWIIHEYSISYELNEGSYPEDRSNPTTYTIETESFALNNPERDGYEFLGWSAPENKEPNKTVSIDKGTTGDLLFIAVWRPLNSYSISYDVNGGEGSIGTVLKLEGESVEISSDSVVSRKGYEFVCWNTESDGTGKDYNPGGLYEEDEDLHLYVKWSIVKYSIEYNLNDGKLATGKSNPDEYTVETADIVLENPTRYGYEFVGWRFKDDSDALASANFTIRKGTTGNLSIVAVWKALDTYTVLYDANGGTGTIETQSKYKGESLTISSGEDLERNGYTFLYWNTKADGTGKDYNPNDFYSADADLRLHAKWNVMKYSIQYDLNGGTIQNDVNPNEYTIETDTFTLVNPEGREGYRFLGWKESDSEDETAQENVSIEKGSTGNKSFTAVWKQLKKYTISFDANGADDGSVPVQLVIYEGDSFEAPSCGSLYKDGYVFYGWNTDSDGSGTLYMESELIFTSNNTVLYAIWRVDPLEYTYLPESDSYSVKCKDKKVSSVVIPSMYKGKPVTGISSDAFSDCGGLTSITIPESVVRILDRAFYNCKGLGYITIPSSVTTIGWEAFKSKSLTIAFAEGMETIPRRALYKSSGIVSVIIPSSVTTIGEEALTAACEFELVFAEGTKSIPWLEYSYANDDPGVVSVIIPSSVNNIGRAFVHYVNLETIVVDAGNTVFYSERNCLIEKESKKLIRGCKTSVIPQDIKSIGDYAFEYCDELEEINIPSSVTSIGEYAFYGCNELECITIPSSVTSIGKYAFYGCNKLGCITIPSSVTSIGDYAFAGRLARSIIFADGTETIPERALYGAEVFSVTIPSSVTSIGKCAFSGCKYLESITIPSNVTSIGENAFSGVRGAVIFAEGMETIPKKALYYADVSSVVIPSSLKVIGKSAFRSCKGLTEIIIPPSVTIIDENAFYGCTGLKSITIPNSVTSIGEYAFKACKELSVVFAEGIGEIPDYALYGASGVVSVVVPSGVRRIGSEAFYNCDGIKEMTIPSGVAAIEEGAFFGCRGLTRITIPKTVTKIEDFVFQKCNALTVEFEDGMTTIPIGALARSLDGVKSVKIPSSVTSIGEYAFVDCTGLTDVVIPSSVTSIGEYAFKNCTGLTDVVIPSSVMSIGQYAFEGCSCLTNITILEGVTSISERSFRGCSGLTSITIPGSVTSIGGFVFYGCNGLTSIVYLGTMAQWNSIQKDVYWNSGTGIYTIHCTDGDIAKK